MTDKRPDITMMVEKIDRLSRVSLQFQAKGESLAKRSGSIW